MKLQPLSLNQPTVKRPSLNSSLETNIIFSRQKTS